MFTEGGDPVFTRTCEIDEDFDSRNYKPSVDGLFSITLQNKDDIAMEKLDSIRIYFSGSHIPFGRGDVLDLSP